MDDLYSDAQGGLTPLSKVCESPVCGAVSYCRNVLRALFWIAAASGKRSDKRGIATLPRLWLILPRYRSTAA